MRNRIIKIGVIGTGGMGGSHVSNITNEVASAHVVALMDVDRARMKEVAAQCGATHTFAECNELINPPRCRSSFDRRAGPLSCCA